MVRSLTDRSKAIIFYSIAFSLSVACVPLSQLLGALTTSVVMFTPLLAVLLMQLLVTRDGYTKAGWAVLGLHQRGGHGWGLALLLPLLVLGFGYSVVCLTGIARFTPPTMDLATLLLNLALAITVALPFVFGEEVGWRGYLLPHLSSLGQRQALFLSGFLHGLWHLPILLSTPYYHSQGSPLIVVPLFLATLTLAGVFYGYLRLMTGSTWPAVLAHSAGNGIWGTLSAYTTSISPLLLEYLAGESGLLPLLALGVVTCWVLSRRGRDSQQATPPVAS